MLKVLSLFTGIGAFEKALKNLNIEYELVAYSEIDKYASKSYSVVHNVDEHQNLGDVSKIDAEQLPTDIDLLTHGSPCQDFSTAGSNRGGDENSGTRSSLMYETLRIVETVKPKFVLWENVKNVLSKKHVHNFNNYVNRLNDLGYTSYYEVLNAKDYGIPQNRERIFVISIRNDVDKGFEFPKPIKLELKLKDMLETKVDKKYYLSEKVQNRFKVTDNTFTKSIIGTTAPKFRTIGQRGLVYQEESVMGSLVATDYKQPKQIAIRLGGVFDDEKSKHQAGSVWDANGLAPTLDTMQGGYRQPCIVDEQSLEERKQIYKEYYQSLSIKTNNLEINTNFKIRKLTPKECWRLQGFTDEDVDKCIAIKISDSQLYKQAGNSICVRVLEAIYLKLAEKYDEFKVVNNENIQASDRND